MPKELQESIWRITVGGTVLVDFGDFLDGPLDLSIQPEVDAVPFVGGNPRTFARPNAFHTLNLRQYKLHDTAQEAAAWQFTQTVAVKALAGVDAVVTIENHTGSVTITKVTVTQADSRIWERCTVMQYSILGGALVSTLAAVVVEPPAGTAIGLPDGSVIGLPDGSALGPE